MILITSWRVFGAVVRYTARKQRGNIWNAGTSAIQYYEALTMARNQLKIHSENILPIIKKWLYSERDIFARELIANACDAIRKLSILRSQGDATPLEEPWCVDVRIDKKEKTLRFSDNGIGMTMEEVEQYIAQIAFSSAQEFVEKYKTNDEKDQIIGHFGLGFYSAYMVAENVEIETLSYRGGKAAHWSCDGSSEYLLEEGKRTSRGTEVILHLSKEEEEYLEEAHLRQVLTHYCAFLPYPIFLNGTRLNLVEPLWLKTPAQCTKKDYLEFYRYLYPTDEDPLFWIHLNVDFPFHLKGILYFPKLQPEVDLKQSRVKLFCNRVFVSDLCQDILPDYLVMLRGTIDSPDIPLNVSRSSLQKERTVQQVAGHISKKVADSLSALYKSEKERFIECWKDISFVVKLGAIEEEKFYDRVKELLLWQRTDGEWTTAEQYVSAYGDKTHGKVFYCSTDKEASSFLNLYLQAGIPVLVANSVVDLHLMQVIERRSNDLQFRRIDGALDDLILDKSKEKTLLDAQGRTEAARVADLIRSKLEGRQVKVEAKSLANAQVPGFLLLQEDQRRLRDVLRLRKETGSLSQLVPPTFVVNTNHSLVASLEQIDARDPKLSGEIVEHLYDLACLSQRELETERLDAFVKRSTALIEKLSL